MKKGKTNIVGAVLLVCVLCLIPPIVSAYKYQIHLSSYPWFSDSDVTYDFFLYWKGQALILLCGVLALYTAVRLLTGKQEVLGQTDSRFLIPLSAYFVLAFLSTLFSEHRETAVWGGYEQWEGMIILGCYVILLVMAYGLVKGKTEIEIVTNGLLVGVLALAFLSAMQFFGHDFFRTENGKDVMNFMIQNELNFTFNFEPGRVYSTLYNPNYVGSYVALMLPVILSLISFRRKWWDILRSGVAFFTGMLLVIMLFGSESVTGCIGIAASLLLFLVIMATNIWKKPVKFAGIAGCCLVFIVAAVLLNRPIFEYGINKIWNPAPNQFIVASMVSQEGKLNITTVNGDVMRLSVEVRDGSYVYEAEDGEGSPAGIYRDESSSRMKFEDKRFQGIELCEKTVEADGEEYNALSVETPDVNKSYTVVIEKQDCQNGLSQTVYRMYNPFEKLDGLREIEQIGFEDSQHFASRRGYIWSRTLPLLKENILLGSGPNTFVYEFPNDDYVGMKNVGYDGAIVTKPHNMFLQIFVQTGFLSLAAFLLLYLFYLIQSMKLYVKKTMYTRMEILGIGLLLGTFGYLVTGLANDSTVAVAPLYWCLLGVGLAVNRFCLAEQQTTKQGGEDIEE